MTNLLIKRSKKEKSSSEVWFAKEYKDLPKKRLARLKKTIFASLSGPDAGLTTIFQRNHQDVTNEILICGCNKWTIKNRKAYGISMSLYDQHPINGKISGDPNADCFGLCARSNSCVMVVADGVNWGEKSRLAAQCAVYSSMQLINKKLYKADRHNIATTHDVFELLLLSVKEAHETILRENAGLTTLCIAIVCPLSKSQQPPSFLVTLDSTLHNTNKQPKQYAVCVINVGDSLAFVFSRKNGTREITMGSHDVTHERDIRDAGGAIGPVGEDQTPELRNLTFSFTYADPGDIVYLTTDGITDNFDPVVTKIAVADLFNQKNVSNNINAKFEDKSENLSDLQNNSSTQFDNKNEFVNSNFDCKTNTNVNQDILGINTEIISTDIFELSNSSEQLLNNNADNLSNKKEKEIKFCSISMDNKSDNLKSNNVSVIDSMSNEGHLLNFKNTNIGFIDNSPLSSHPLNDDKFLDTNNEEIVMQLESITPAAELESENLSITSYVDCAKDDCMFESDEKMMDLDDYVHLDFKSNSLEDIPLDYNVPLSQSIHGTLCKNIASTMSDTSEKFNNGETINNEVRTIIENSNESLLNINKSNVNYLNIEIPLPFTNDFAYNNISLNTNRDDVDSNAGVASKKIFEATNKVENQIVIDDQVPMNCEEPVSTISCPNVDSFLNVRDCLEDILSEDGKPIMRPHERHQYAIKEMERVIHEFELFAESACSAQELCGALLQHVLKLTDTKRKVLENPRLYHRKRLKDEEARRMRDEEIVSCLRKCPGKLDHATVVAYEVGHYHHEDDCTYDEVDDIYTYED